MLAIFMVWVSLRKLPRQRGSILYCTTGIMLKWLASDRYVLIAVSKLTSLYA